MSYKEAKKERKKNQIPVSYKRGVKKTEQDLIDEIQPYLERHQFKFLGWKNDEFIGFSKTKIRVWCEIAKREFNPSMNEMRRINSMHRRGIEEVIPRLLEKYPEGTTLRRISKEEYLLTCPICTNSEVEFKTRRTNLNAGNKPCDCKARTWSCFPNRLEETDNLYLVKFTDKETGYEFMKVGRTFNSVEDRFKSGSKYKHWDLEIVKTITDKHEVVYKLENKLTGHLYRNHNRADIGKKFDGATECYTLEALNDPLIKTTFNLT